MTATFPQNKTITSTPYEVFVYRLRTGEVVRKMPFTGTPGWESGINITGSWSVNVALFDESLTKDELNQVMDPWYWGWAIVRGYSIVQAGPVVSEDFNDGDDITTVTGAGLWALYKEKRILANASRGFTGAVEGTDADVAFGPGTMSDKGSPIPPENRNLSLHTILKRLLENEQAKGGGSVPLVLPADIAGDATRTYLGPELAMTGARMYEITQVNGGPEFELMPEFTDTTRHFIRHVARIGNPRLGQLGYPWAWRYRSALTALGFISDGSRMTNRHFERGGGFDRNVLVGFYQDMEGVTEGTFQTEPLLEAVGSSHTNNNSLDELNQYAVSEVENGLKPELNFNAEVSIEGDTGDGELPPSPVIDLVENGDTGVFQVLDHPRLPDGNYYIRVLRKKSASKRDRVSLITEVLGMQA